MELFEKHIEIFVRKRLELDSVHVRKREPRRVVGVRKSTSAAKITLPCSKASLEPTGDHSASVSLAPPFELILVAGLPSNRIRYS